MEYSVRTKELSVRTKTKLKDLAITYKPSPNVFILFSVLHFIAQSLLPNSTDHLETLQALKCRCSFQSPCDKNKNFILRPLCSRERQRTTGPWEQLTAQDRNVAVSFTSSSLNFKSPHHTLFIPCFKKSRLERKGKTVLLGANPTSSEILRLLAI